MMIDNTNCQLSEGGGHVRVPPPRGRGQLPRAAGAGAGRSHGPRLLILLPAGRHHTGFVSILHSLLNFDIDVS